MDRGRLARVPRRWCGPEPSRNVTPTGRSGPASRTCAGSRSAGLTRGAGPLSTPPSRRPHRAGTRLLGAVLGRRRLRRPVPRLAVSIGLYLVSVVGALAPARRPTAPPARRHPALCAAGAGHALAAGDPRGTDPVPGSACCGRTRGGDARHGQPAWVDVTVVAVGGFLVTVVGSWVHLSWLLAGPGHRGLLDGAVVRRCRGQHPSRPRARCRDRGRGGRRHPRGPLRHRRLGPERAGARRLRRAGHRVARRAHPGAGGAVGATGPARGRPCGRDGCLGRPGGGGRRSSTPGSACWPPWPCWPCPLPSHPCPPSGSWGSPC